jgi:hypothetical protein
LTRLANLSITSTSSQPGLRVYMCASDWILRIKFAGPFDIHGPSRISFLSRLGRSRRSRSDRISGRSISSINSVNRPAGHAIHKRGLVYRIIIISIRNKKKKNQMSLRNLYISLEHFNCLSGLQEI